jgi:hypothetical protein
MLSAVKTWNLLFVALTIAGLTVLYLIFSTYESEDDWEQFKQAHHCVSVGSQTGANQSGWKCDDGKIHHRWRQQR